MSRSYMIADPNPYVTAKPYQAVYRAEPFTAIQTIGHALRVLYSVPQPILHYKQRISLLAPHLDLSFAEHVRHDRENQIVTISFPSELVGIVSRIQNSHRCRMVTYWKDPVTEFIREIQVEPTTEINCLSGKNSYPQSIRIYTGGVEDLVVSFHVWIGKPQATFGKPEATFGKPEATFGKPEATFGKPEATFGKPEATFGKPEALCAPRSML